MITAGHCGGTGAYSMEFGGTDRGSGTVFGVSSVTRVSFIHSIIHLFIIVFRGEYVLASYKSRTDRDNFIKLKI